MAWNYVGTITMSSKLIDKLTLVHRTPEQLQRWGKRWDARGIPNEPSWNQSLQEALMRDSKILISLSIVFTLLLWILPGFANSILGSVAPAIEDFPVKVGPANVIIEFEKLNSTYSNATELYPSPEIIRDAHLTF